MPCHLRPWRVSERVFYYLSFMASRPEYIEITCKSAVNRVQGMPYLKWSLNPYAGCVHRCRFCFAVQYRVVADQGTSSTQSM